MDISTSKRAFRSTTAKVIAVVVAACAAVMLSLHVSKNVFGDMLVTVEDVTSPDRNLNLINTIFRSVTQLQQRQREMILHGNAKSREALTEESHRLMLALDSLQSSLGSDTTQHHRVEAMKALLEQRGRVFDHYLALRKEVLDSRTLALQMDSLSKMVSSSIPVDTTLQQGDTRVEAELPTVVTDTIVTEVPVRTSFLKRLFAKKNEKTPVLRQQIIREIRTRTDTLSLTQRQDIIDDVKFFIDSIKHVHVELNARFLNQELELMNAANKIMNELFDLLHEIEAMELAALSTKNHQASSVVTSGLDQLKTIIGVFLVSITLLTVLILFDITKSNRYRKALQHAKEEAEHLGNVKQQFLASMSHELRTPLQSIVGFAEQVRSQATPDRGMIEAIYRSSDHLLHIVNDALDYSKIVSGKFVFENKPFRLIDVLSEVSEVMGLQAAAKSIALNFKSNIPAGLVVTGDSFRLRQILYNLIGNAIKFTEQGSVSFLAEIEEGERNRLSVSIIDTGVGMSEEELTRIFNVFEQGGEQASRKGTGLGLSITKELVEGQGGSIAVESAPGIGSKFRVVLTYAPATQNVDAQNGGDTLLRIGGKVVVIDDDPYIGRLVSTILDKYGVTNEVFHSATEFLKRDWDPAIRVMLVDIRMPGMSGLELCRFIKENIRTDKLRIMAITAQTLPEEHHEIMDAGFDAILVKPFREADIIGAMQTLSSHKQPFNLSSIARMSRGDDDLFYTNLEILVEETRRDIDLLNECKLTDSTFLFADILHRLAGRLGQGGAKELAARLRSLEINFREGEFDDELNKTLELCIEDVIAVTNEIEQYMQKARDVAP